MSDHYIAAGLPQTEEGDCISYTVQDMSLGIIAGHTYAKH